MHLYTGKIDGAETIKPVFSVEKENDGIKIFWYSGSDPANNLNDYFSFLYISCKITLYKINILKSTHAICYTYNTLGDISNN